MSTAERDPEWERYGKIIDAGIHSGDPLDDVVHEVGPAPPEAGNADIVYREPTAVPDVVTGPVAEGWTLAEFESEPDPGPVPILCEKVMAQGGIHVIFGPASSCKSWAALHLSLGLCSTMTNIGFCGLDDAPVSLTGQRVLWVYGSEDSRRRVRYRAVEVARQYPTLDPAAIKFVDATRHPLNTEAGRAWLEVQIQAHEATFVVVDTVSSCTTVKSKDGDEVRAFLNHLHSVLTDDTNTATDFLLNHHSRKLSAQARQQGVVSEGADGLLGAGEWRNLTDDIVLLAAKDGCPDDILVQVVKSKDLPGTIGARHAAWSVETRSFTEIEPEPTTRYTATDSAMDAIILAIAILGGSDITASELAKRDDLGVPTRKNTRADAIKAAVQAGYLSIEGSRRWAKFTLSTAGLERAATLGFSVSHTDTDTDTDG